MRVEDETDVAQPPQAPVAFLTDVERVAPCLPGASIDGRDGDDYTGSMKVKVGPITGTYKGKMRFLEQDEGALRAVMSARAAEVNGQGDAEAGGGGRARRRPRAGAPRRKKSGRRWGGGAPPGAASAWRPTCRCAGAS